MAHSLKSRGGGGFGSQARFLLLQVLARNVGSDAAAGMTQAGGPLAPCFLLVSTSLPQRAAPSDRRGPVTPREAQLSDCPGPVSPREAQPASEHGPV